MTAPIDRIENVRASVADIERQMEACRAAGVPFPPTLTWRLLSECRSLLADREQEEARIRADERRRIADLIAQDRSSNDFMSRFLDEYAYEANRRAEDVARIAEEAS